jgi:hypothetical protein
MLELQLEAANSDGFSSAKRLSMNWGSIDKGAQTGATVFDHNSSILLSESHMMPGNP